jgi:hypothetical protein
MYSTYAVNDSENRENVGYHGMPKAVAPVHGSKAPVAESVFILTN